MEVAKAKINLAKRFDEIFDEFRRDAINGSIELHFSNGNLAKLFQRRAESAQ